MYFKNLKIKSRKSKDLKNYKSQRDRGFSVIIWFVQDEIKGILQIT